MQEKYQAWHKEAQRMYQVLGLFCGGARQAISGYPIDVGFSMLGIEHFEIDQVILRRWTYLTDKHGKDLYTGDLCKFEHWEEVVQVMWCNNGFYIVMVNSEDLSPQLIPHNWHGTCEGLELIGNIYRNPGISDIYDANGAGGYL